MPVIVDREMNFIAERFQFDGHVFGACVPRHVRQCFLRNPEQMSFGFIRQPAEVIELKIHRDAGTRREPFA